MATLPVLAQFPHRHREPSGPVAKFLSGWAGCSTQSGNRQPPERIRSSFGVLTGWPRRAAWVAG